MSRYQRSAIGPSGGCDIYRRTFSRTHDQIVAFAYTSSRKKAEVIVEWLNSGKIKEAGLLHTPIRQLIEEESFK